MKNYLPPSFKPTVSGIQRALSSGQFSDFVAPVCRLLIFLSLAGWSQQTLAQTTLAGFDVNGLTNGGPTTLAASTVATNITAGALTKSASVTSSGANDAFGGTGWSRSTDPASITGNANVTFTVKANSGYVLSLSAINPLSYRRSGTGPINGLIQYQIDGGSFINIGAPVSFTNTTNSGATLAPIDLSGIPGLQNLLPTITVTFRIIPYGASANTGTWYINNTNTASNPDLAVTGTVACPAITATLAGTTTICSGSSTTLAATITGGTSPYTVRVTDGSNTSVVTNYTSGSAITITPATSKTYTIVSVRDANTCTATVSGTATVTVETITAAITNLAGDYCKNAPAVTLTGTPTGSGFTGGFTVDGATATIFDPASLTVGNHTVVYSVTNTTGCSSTTSQTVRVRALPTPNITGLANNYCKNAPAVTLTGTPAGGAFTLDGVPATGFDPATLTAGQSYTVVYSVTNANGCSASSRETFRVRPVPIATLTSSNSLNCAVTSTTLTAGTGTGYSYVFSGPGLIISDLVSGTAIANLGGAYSVTVTSGFGCTAVASTTVVSDIASPTATIAGTLTVCEGLSTTLTASGGTSYAWSTGATTPMVSVTAGTYSVTVTAGNGCTALASATVTPVANPTATIGGTLTVITGGSTTLTASGGTSFTWSTGETTASVSVTAGTYSVTAANASGCVSTTSATVTEVNTAPVATANNNQTATVGLAFSYTVNAFGDAETPNSLTYTASINPTNGFTFDPATRVISGTAGVVGVSSVTVTATDFGGLSASTTFTITVSPPTCGTLTVPGNYATIQAAINAACPGALIQVAAGIYTEQLTIGKSLSIVGAGPGTVVQAPGTLVAGNLDAAHRNIIEIYNGAAVTIMGINVNGPFATSNGCGDLLYGININGGAGLNLSNASITNIYLTPTSLGGCQSGIGIRAGFNALGSPGSLTATNVTVSGYQKAGIIIDGVGSTGSITNATVTGAGATSAIAQNGIQISRGATGNVQSSTITGNNYANSNDPNTTATGLLAFDSGAITATGNSFSGNNIGAYAGATGPLTANNNQFSNNDYASIYAETPAALAGSGNSYDKQVTNNNKAGTVYSRIQAAIDDATANDILTAAAGTFAEDITIDKKLTINGANAGINPNTGTRGAETIVVPATTGADYDNGGNNVVVTLTGAASGATLDGLTIDGNNPNLTGQPKNVVINGVDIDAATGISSYSTDAGNLTIKNNIVRNISVDGIEMGGTATSTFNTIQANKFDNIAYESTTTGSGQAIYIEGNAYATITDNVMTRVLIGVQTGNCYYGAPSGTPSIANNAITTYDVGIFHNLQYQSATGYAIANNTIMADASMSAIVGSPPFAGLLIYSILDGVSATFTSNTVGNGFTYGVDGWNMTSPTVLLSGGSVQGTTAGVRVRNHTGNYGDGNANLTVNGVTITNSPIGVLSFDDPLAAASKISSVTVTGNTQIAGTGTFTAVAISGPDASASITGNASSFVGNGSGVGVDISGGTASVTANRVTNFATGINVSNGGQLTGAANNFITGNTDGLVYTANAGATQGVVTINDLSGNTGKAISNGLTSTTINANCNWFGPANGTINPTYVTGNVSTTMVLANGTDEDGAAAGFQNTSCFTPPTAPVLTLSPAPQLGPNTSYCIGDNPTVTSNYTTGTNSFTVQARSDGSTTVTTGNSVTIIQGAGAYDVFATSSQNGYTSPVSATFVQIAPVVTTFVSSKAAYCVGETVSLTALGCNVTASSPNLYKTLLRSTDGSNNENQGTAFLPDGVTSYTYTQFAVTTPTPYTITAECVNTGTGQVCGRTQLVITANPLPVATLSSSNTLTCATPTATLTASGGQSYTFSGPGIVSQNGSATALVNASGTYSVTVTSTAGCVSTTTTTVFSDTAVPMASLAASGTITCALPTATLTANVATRSGTDTYAFSGPNGPVSSTGNTAVVSSGGIYSVTVTSTNGCTSMTTTTVASDTAAPTATLVSSNTLTCAVTSATLTASGGVTYAFSGPGTFSSDPVAGTAVVSTAGSYSVTVTAANGCTAITTTSVISDTVAPTATLATVGSATLTCAQTSVTLVAGGGVSYAFSGTGIVSQSPSGTAIVDTRGIYSVTVTATNGCTSVTTMRVFRDTDKPTASLATVGSATLTCAQTSVTLAASATPAGSYTYAFSAGATPLGPDQATVSTQGVYSVTATGANGCTDVANVRVFKDTNKPTATLTTQGSSTLTCAQTSVTLVAGGGVSYAFSGTGIVSQDPSGTAVVNTRGVYSVTATATNGCTDVTTIRVFGDVAKPVASLTTVGSVTLTCAQTSVTLAASATPAGSYTYAFSAGATPLGPDQATVSTQGVYSVTATGANGCTDVANVRVFKDTNKPTATLTTQGSSTLTCAQTSVTLVAGGGVSYAFSGTGIVSQDPSGTAVVNTRGVYSVTATATNGCTDVTTIRVFSDTDKPTASLATVGGATITCNQPSVTLTASATGSSSYTYAFSTGATPIGPNQATVSTPGVYTVTVTGANGCTDVATERVFRDVAKPTASLMGTTTICAGGTANLVATVSGGTTPYSLTYSDGTSASAISSYTSGTNIPVSPTATSTYTIAVSGANGCPATITGSGATVTVNQLPNASLVSSNSLNCGVTSATLTATSGAGYTYAFSSGASQIGNSNQAIVTAGGTYSVIITSTGGCSSTATTTVISSTAVPTVTLAVSGPITCAQTSVTLTASTGTRTDTYAFSGPNGIVPSTGNTATVSTAGTYTVTATSTNGCTSMTTTTVTSDTAVTSLTLTSSNNLSCGVTSATLTANLDPAVRVTAYTYAFGPGATQIGTSNQATITTAGPYSVTATSVRNGCSVSATTTVTSDTAVPTVSLVASGTISCATPSVTLMANTGTRTDTYAFAGPSGPIPSTSNTATVSSGGIYSVTATSTNGCTSMTTTTVYSDTAVPSATLVVSGAITCVSPTATLTANPATRSGTDTYAFAGPSGPISSTGNTATVSMGGIYSVTVTSANGCLSTTTTTVTSDTAVTSLTLTSSNDLSCGVTSATLTASPDPTVRSAYTYLFGPGATQIGTSNQATITTAGSYSVTATSVSNGCSVSATTTVTSSTAVPMVTLTNNGPITCASASVTLTAGTNARSDTYAFSGPNGLITSTRNTAVVSMAGVYSVTATSTNGCTSMTTTTVTSDTAVTSLTLTSSNDLSCGVTSATLTASPDPTVRSAYTYVFSAGTTQISPNQATVTVAGPYSVTATSVSNGCSVSATTTVTSSTAVPMVTLTNNGPITCASASVTLTAGTNARSDTYAFSGPNGLITSTRNTAVVSMAGVYSVTATSTNGCTSMTTTTVTSDTAVTSLTLTSSNDLSCGVTSATLTASPDPTVRSAYTYLFGPGATQIGTSNQATITTAGSYSVTATSVSNGCSVSATTTVTSSTAVPMVTLTNNGPITCASASVTLTAGTNARSDTYAFSGPNGLITSTRNTAVVNTPGVYSVTATSTNGCTSMTTTTVYSDTTVPSATLVVSGAITCASPTATLTANPATRSGTDTYAFSGPSGPISSTGNTATVSMGGIYSVTVTSANGCLSTTTTTVTSDTAVTSLTLTSSNDLSCGVTSATLTASPDPTVRSAYTYVFSAGTTQISPNQATVTVAGPYSVTATSVSNGCSVSATTTVTSDTAVPSVTLVNNGPLTCAQTSVTLTANTGTRTDTYAFFGPGGSIPSTRNTATVSSAGNYSVIVTSTSGCSSTATTTVASDTAVPTATLTASGTLTCAQTSVTLTANASGGSGYTYAFSPGASQLGNTNQATVTLAGSYSVTVTSATGCSVVATVTVSSSTSVVTPDFATRGNQAIADGLTSVTVVQNTTPVMFNATNCSGTLNWNGNGQMGTTTLNAPTSATGVFVYQATCTVGSCVSSPASVTVTVTPANTAPVPTANANQTATVGQQFTYTANAFTDAETPNSLVYTASFNPANSLTFNPATRVIQGTPTNTGVTSVTITATDPGGLSASTTFTITVNPVPVLTNLTVLSRDPESGNLNTNTLKPYLLLQNDGSSAIPYNELTVRYYLTLENPQPLRFDINYAQMGNNNVHLNYVPLSPARTGATGYIEFSFDAAAGSLAPMSNAVIQDLINKQDYSMFFQGDDYSYVNNANFAANNHITAYRNGVLVYGIEPLPTGPPAPLGLTLTANPTMLLTTGNTTLTASASGGTPGYTYAFSGPGTITPSGNTASVSNLPAGVQTFSVVVTDNTAPVAQTASATVSVTVTAPANQTPVATANANQTATVGQQFTYTVNAFNDDTPNSLTYTASIDPANGFTFNAATRMIQGTPQNTGLSSVTITATDPGGLSANTVFTITVNPAPVAPTALTLTASASPTTILTTGSTQLQASVSGGTPGYTYTFSGPGTIQTNGNTATVSNLPDGVQTFTVTARDATSPVNQTITTTVSVTVSAAPNQAPVATANANQTATQGVQFSYTANTFTDDTPNSLTYTASIDPANGLTFNAATRMIQGTPQNTGVSSVTITATDPGGLSASTTFTINVLPAPVVTDRLTVYSRDPDNGQLNTNTLKPYLQLQNDGNTPIPYGELTVRYWLTVENPALFRFEINYAQLGSDKVHLNYVMLPQPRQGASGYVEFSFDASAGSLAANSNSGPIQDLINKQDYSYFNQADDYSYVNTGNFTPNSRITAYRNGVLIYGVEPPSPVRVAVENVDAPLHVEVLGNPLSGGELAVKITGATGQPLHLRVTDLNGHLVTERMVERASTVEEQQLSVNHQAAGLLFLQVSTPGQTQTVKVFKAN